MDITFETEKVWKFRFEFEPLTFLSAAAVLMEEGDVALFGAYEPTAELVSALVALGAIPQAHIPEFFTSFDMNRSEHPHGSAFEYRIGTSGFTDILKLDRAILRQADIPSFYDHFIAYRPHSPRIPLISFHDAACGGTLYVSDIYERETVSKMATLLAASFSRVRNPVLQS
jgi:hypothetical protein